MPAVPETSSALQAQLTRIPPPDKKSGHKPSRTEKLKVWKKLGRHADPGEDAKSTQSDDGPPQLPTLASMQHRPLPPTPLAETNIPPRAPPTEQVAYQRRDLVLQPDAIYQSPQLAAAATADTTMPRRKLTSENLTRLVSADVHSSLGTGTIPIHLGNPSTPTRSQTLPTKLTETTPQSIESIKARANSFLLDEDPEDIGSGSVVANGTVMLPHKRKTPEAVAATPDNRLEQRIWAVLREFYEEYPSMQGPEGETLEHAVDSLTLTLRRYDGQMKDKQNKIDDLDKQAKRLCEQTSRARSKADICRKALTAREAELTTKQRTVDEKSSEIQSLGRENSTLRAENRTLKADQESWIRTAQTNETLLRDRDRIKGMYDEKIKEAANERQYANQQELLLSAKNQVLTNEIQKYQGNVASLTSSNDVLRGKNIKLEQQLSTATQAESRKDQELRQLQADLDETRDLLAEERKTVMDKLAEQEETLRREHESHTWKLKSDAENLKKAIVARDHFKGLRDRDITGKFAKLATDIEDISTVEWDQSRASNWPVSEQEMDRLHRANTRLLKQHIVQNSVWLLLHKHVFQSPFTVMGTEGERLDTDWREIYSSADSLAWPERSPDQEKERYEAARSFLEAIEPSTKRTSNDQDVKRTFDISVLRATTELKSALGRVAELDQGDHRVLDRIVQLSAKTWLECCAQRYRLLVVLSEGVEELLLPPWRNIRAVNLLVKPDIKRFGTSQGENLAKSEAVTGWRGLVASYPSR